MSTDNERLLALVAKMYYIDKVKQNEIAKRFNITSMMVSRLLKDAETKGIITFHVKMPWQMDMDLSRAVKEKFGLKDCYVFDIAENEELTFRLGSLLADYFSQILPRKDAIVGLSWGNTIMKFVESLPYIKAENLSLVQLSGAFSGKGGNISPTDLLNAVSKKLDAKPYFLHAPLYAATVEMRNNFLNDPINHVIKQMAKKSDINIIGASELSRNSNTLKSGNINEDDFRELRSLNSIGDLTGIFLDREGNCLEWTKSSLYTGANLEEISKAKIVICVAGELRKLDVLYRSCLKKYFNTLFTTRILAEALLEKHD
jgi:DNA-binding transcriptional regulator LsrR (DeoR family)